MACPNCGRPTRSGATFCGECGYKLAVAPIVGPAVVAAPVPVPVSSTTGVQAPVVAPLLRPPPPPPIISGQVEVVPFAVQPVVETPSVPVISAPPAAPVVAAAPPPVESVDETRVSVRRRAGAHWRLVLPDGRHVEVAGSVLVGRDASVNPRWPGATLLSVLDPTQSVSKTHAVFEVDGDGLWVTDLDSTNGVVITQPDGVEVDLNPNVRERIQAGADVELGDFIVQVEKD
jgi:hypothetical protein